MALPVFIAPLAARLAPLFIKAALKYWLAGAIAIGLIGWFGYEKLKSYNMGKAVVIDRVNTETRKVQDAWYEIDRQHRSVDDALASLRKRARSR